MPLVKHPEVNIALGATVLTMIPKRLVLYLRLVKLAILRLDSGPLDGEAVGIQPRLGQQADVLLIAV